MARYNVVKPETGENHIIECSIHEIMEWYENNPGWERDWSHGAAGVAREGVGEWKSKLTNKHSGWKTVLDKVKNAPGSNVKDLY